MRPVNLISSCSCEIQETRFKINHPLVPASSDLFRFSSPLLWLVKHGTKSVKILHNSTGTLNYISLVCSVGCKEQRFNWLVFFSLVKKSIAVYWLLIFSILKYTEYHLYTLLQVISTYIIPACVIIWLFCALARWCFAYVWVTLLLFSCFY